MYSSRAWGGGTDPFILTKFLPYKPPAEGAVDDPIVSFVVFEWKDEKYIGADTPQVQRISIEARDQSRLLKVSQRESICDQLAIDAGHCGADDLGKYILLGNETVYGNIIKTEAIHLKSDTRKAINYAVQRTGYYCVSTHPMDASVPYKAIAEFRNAYGELPGAQIARLPFYGGITIVYAVIGAFWAFLYFQNRSDILPVQNYITATIIFLVVEMLMTWGYYDYMNRHGNNAGAKVIMTIVSILNAGRNSLSFYLLLIVCLGWGVVLPSLGKKMVYARWLALTHFVFGVIYAVGSLTVRPEDAGPLVLLVVLPLAATGTAFYVWTLNALGATMKDLAQRKQRVKALMYRKLWWCILGSVLIIFVFFLVNVLTFSGRSDLDFTPSHWQTRWFVLDGWLNLVYLADVAFIAYLWRPTANNRRFAMSDELSQEDEGFEIASVRDSLDFDEEDQNEDQANGGHLKPPYSPQMRSNARNESPLPAPQPQRPAASPGRLDGETLFAVGEGEASDTSDDDHSDRARAMNDESTGLTRKHS
ncbi:MAG: hypothetical protein M1828_006023 [Chrysothrix sp. TS-e1954]|nr:MAG: hypothetical protein M1828_006023 [Chrysothrix sp. TS-e1954]